MNIQTNRYIPRVWNSLQPFITWPNKNSYHIAQKGLWAIIDQSAFAISNFLLGIVLARWLSPEQYGTYVTAMTALWFVGLIHTALITEPMLVFGPSRYQHQLQVYLGHLVFVHIAFSLIMGILLFGIVAINYWILGLTEFVTVLCMIAVAGGFILFTWLMRRACYVELQARMSATSGIGYTVIILAGTYLLNLNQVLSPIFAILLTGLASLLVGIWLSQRMKVIYVLQHSALSISTVALEHWNYGRWLVIARVFSWFPESLWYWILPFWSSLGSSGAFRAIMNLNLPVHHAIAVFSLLLTPTLVKARGSAKFTKILVLSTVLLTLASMSYWFILFTFRTNIVEWLYNGRYQDYADITLTLGLWPAIVGIGTVLNAALRALEKPESIFRCYTYSFILSISLGVFLTARLGAWGSALGLVISTAAGFAVSAYELRKALVAEYIR